MCLMHVPELDSRFSRCVLPPPLLAETSRASNRASLSVFRYCPHSAQGTIVWGMSEKLKLGFRLPMRRGEDLKLLVSHDVCVCACVHHYVCAM